MGSRPSRFPPRRRPGPGEPHMVMEPCIVRIRRGTVSVLTVANRTFPHPGSLRTETETDVTLTGEITLGSAIPCVSARLQRGPVRGPQRGGPGGGWRWGLGCRGCSPVASGAPSDSRDTPYDTT